MLPLALFLALQAAPQALPAWMAGCWAGDIGQRRVTERWVAADATTLVGVSTTVAGGVLREFEFLRIVSRDGAVAYLAQPGGRAATTFTATSSGVAEVVFENPQHDFPRRIGYRRAGDTLTAWIDGGPAAPGKRQEFPMARVSCDLP
jgi:Domain of unknown function (DUF6265)